MSLKGLLVAEGQGVSLEGYSVSEDIFILLRPYYGLDVPRGKGTFYPSTSEASLLMKKDYGCKVV